MNLLNEKMPFNLILNVFLPIDFTAQKIKFSIKDISSNCDLIRSFLWIFLHLLKKSLMENFIFCTVFESCSFLWKLHSGKLNPINLLKMSWVFLEGSCFYFCYKTIQNCLYFIWKLTHDFYRHLNVEFKMSFSLFDSFSNCDGILDYVLLRAGCITK